MEASAALISRCSIAFVRMLISFWRTSDSGRGSSEEYMRGCRVGWDCAGSMRSSSYNFSPGRRPVNWSGISFSGIKPHSYRGSHIQQKNFSVFGHGTSLNYEASGFSDTHKIACNFWMSHGNRHSLFNLFTEQWHHGSAAVQYITEAHNSHFIFRKASGCVLHNHFCNSL